MRRRHGVDSREGGIETEQTTESLTWPTALKCKDSAHEYNVPLKLAVNPRCTKNEHRSGSAVFDGFADRPGTAALTVLGDRDGVGHDSAEEDGSGQDNASELGFHPDCGGANVSEV